MSPTATPKDTDIKETRVEQHERSNEELRDWTPGEPPPRDPKTRRPLKTGDTLTDEHQPYGVAKDPKTLEPLPPEPVEPGEEVEEPPPLEAPDTATLTAQEQNHWEVMTGERLQKDPEAEEAAAKSSEERRKKQAEDRRKAAERRSKAKPGTKPDQGLPSGRPARPDNALPGTAEPKR